MKKLLLAIWIATWTQSMEKLVRCDDQQVPEAGKRECSETYTTQEERRFATKQQAEEYRAECGKHCTDFKIKKSGK